MAKDAKFSENEWYPCFVCTVMWKAHFDMAPRIVFFRVENELMHDIESWLNEHPESVKI